MDVRNRIKDWIQESIQVKQDIHDDPKLRRQIENAVAVVVRTIKNGGTVFACGNGGSSSDSAHFVGELMNRFTKKREYPLPAFDLSAQNATITAIANDYSFDQVFAKQLQALAKPQDVLIAITTSGKSENIKQALIKAYEIGMSTILLTGDLKDNPFPISLMVTVPSTNTPIIQESHIMIIHMLCKLIDDALEGR